jgi:hypothetical protein
VQLAATSTDAADNAVGFSWTSSDTAIAEVDQDGLVVAVDVGTVTITATGNASAATGSTTVTVYREGDGAAAWLGLFALLFLFSNADGHGGNNGGPCFIATAAYGTPLAGEIDTLRALRDTWLFDSALGSASVDMYYRFSPAIADVISGSPLLTLAVRILLIPVLLVAKLILLLSPTAAVLLAAIGAAAIVARRFASQRTERPRG